MKKFNWIIVVMFALTVVFSSCDHSQDPQPYISNQASGGGGNDDDPPIILGDTTVNNTTDTNH